MEAGSVIAIVLLLLSLVSVFAVPVLFIKKRKLEKKLLKATSKQQAFSAENELLQEKVQLLSPYEGIVDANQEAKRLVGSAQAESLRIRQEAEKLKNDANGEAHVTLSEARAKAKHIQGKAQENVDTAVAEARRIVESAKEEAKEIAGDAIKAKNNADQYERAAKAMKNIIHGYGDEYLVPNRSTLDELAEDFGHKEAGVELKKARQHTKSMIKNGIAATCDYVENHRKTTAIQFVLDAFNGKVDTTLSKAKHDNFGKLHQEILDGYALVNNNGKAFRDARILQDYLSARIDELKWAVATNELKLEEREEQRRIKEAMREEEKARREYEKAMKTAAKEEKLLQDAMTKARKELEAASEEQRLQLEKQLQELQEKLEEAEAKNERALSMAQQTKRGHVYVISNIGSFGEDVFKIGLTRRLEPLDRVRELGDASVPFPFDVHAMIHSEDAPALENKLHKAFQYGQLNKVNSRKEFFKVGIAEIRQLVADKGIEAHWTLKAEAREYRESLAMEETMIAEAQQMAS